MILDKPYGEDAAAIAGIEDEGERRAAALRIVTQASDVCAMCAHALDSVFMGDGEPDGMYAEGVARAVEMELARCARDLQAAADVM